MSRRKPTLNDELCMAVQKVLDKRLDMDEIKYLNQIEFAKIISDVYHINLKQLCKYLPNSGKFCKGYKKDGSPCTGKAKLNGMCNNHMDQKPGKEPIEMTMLNNEGIKHSHTFLECIYKPGCPACETSKKGFKDLRGIM